MNEYLPLFNNENAYALTSWSSEKIKHNVANWKFTTYSDSTYKIIVEYFLDESTLIDTEETIVPSGIETINILNKSRYVRFNIVDLIPPCVLRTQGFYYNENIQETIIPSSVSVNNFPSDVAVNNFPSDVAVNNLPSSIAINNIPSNAFEELKCGTPNTFSAYKWSMSALNVSGVTFASGNIKTGYRTLQLQSDVLADSYGQVSTRGTLNLLTQNKAGAITFSRYFGKETLYQSSTPMTIRWTTIFDVGNYVDTKRDESYIGFGNVTSSTTKNPRNFFGVGFSGSNGSTTSEFGLFYYRDGVKIFIPQSSFNVDPLDGTGSSGKILNPYTGVIWEVDMAYLGFSNVTFRCFIDDKFITFHIFRFSNVSTETHVTDPSFGFLSQINNTLPAISSPASGSPCMGNGSFGIILWSKYTSTNYNGFDRNISYLSSGGETPIIIIRNPPTYNGRINSVLGTPLLISTACDGARLCKFNIYATDSSKISGGVWTALNQFSPMEYNNTGTYVIDISERVFSFVLGKTDTSQIDMTKYSILAGSNVVWVITVTSGSNSDVYCAFSWSEIH